MQQKDTKYLPADPDTPPPSTLGMASIGQNSTFCLSEHGHVAYQVYENHECSNMVPNILPADAPPHLGMGLTSQSSCFIEQGLAAYQIKGNHEKQHHACKYFARRPPSLDPGDGVNRSKFNFFRNGHVEYQIKGNHECTRHGCRYFSGRSPYPPPPLTTLGVWSIDPNSTFSEQGHVAYQIKGNLECSNMVVIIFLTDHP